MRNDRRNHLAAFLACLALWLSTGALCGGCQTEGKSLKDPSAHFRHK